MAIISQFLQVRSLGMASLPGFNCCLPPWLYGLPIPDPNLSFPISFDSPYTLTMSLPWGCILIESLILAIFALIVWFSVLTNSQHVYVGICIEYKAFTCKELSFRKRYNQKAEKQWSEK